MLLVCGGLAFAPETDTAIASGNTGSDSTCQRLYWFDSDSTECGLREFCGAFMYRGLYTFADKSECEAKLKVILEPEPENPGGRPELECKRMYWFDEESTSCGLKEFCGDYMYRGLQIFTDREECSKAIDRQLGPQSTASYTVPNITVSGSGGKTNYTRGICPIDEYESLEVCNKTYVPVCATIVNYGEDGSYKKFRKQFSNKCEACVYSNNTSTVVDLTNGECEQETDMECPLIERPSPDYCGNGTIQAKYREMNGKRCIVGYDCVREPLPPMEETPVFNYTETNSSIGKETTFNLYKSGAMKETIIDRITGERTTLKGEMFYTRILEFMDELEELGFFEMELNENNCKIEITETGMETESCSTGGSYHKMYARWNKENKVLWYGNMNEEHKAIDYALEMIKKYEGIMKENMNYKEKYIGLGNPFNLELGEKAKVRETGFELKLERIDEDLAVFSIAPGYTGYKQTAENQTPGTSGTASVNATTISANQWIKIEVGKRKAVFGHLVNLNNILAPRCTRETDDSGTSSMRCIGGTPLANVTIEKESAPDTYLTAFLGKKFEIEPQQNAIIHTENRTPVMNFGLEAINVLADCPIQEKCKTDEETGVEICPMIYCDTRPIARVLYTPIEQSYMRSLSIREGETATQGRFKFHFADLINGKAVFVVHKLEDQFEFKEVKLREKFKLEEKQTALIIEEDLFVTLNYITSRPFYEGKKEENPQEQVPGGIPVEGIGSEQMVCTEELKMCSDGTTGVARDPYNNCEFKPCPGETPRQEKYAVVSVWKKGFYNEPVPLTKEAEERIRTIERNVQSVGPMSAGEATVSKTSTTSTTSAVLAQRTYRLKPGESLKIHGIELTLGFVDSETASFLAEKPAFGGTINVHLNERFKLEENMTANVLGANMNLELLGISSYTECSDGDETLACVEEKRVKLGVSRLFKERPIAKKVNYSENAMEIASEVIHNVADSSFTIEALPPAPFTVLDLEESETASIGEFEISVLSIWADHAEFVVKDKSTGIAFKFVISKGWNLSSFPGEFRTQNQSECNSSNFRLFGFNARTQGFDKVREPIPGKAYWLYNPNESCEVQVELTKAVSMYELGQLQKGWNFVPVLAGMLENKLSEMGNCEFNGAFAYDAETKQWISVTGTKITESLLGKGIAVNVEETCSLLGAETIDEIPELPALPEVE